MMVLYFLATRSGAVIVVVQPLSANCPKNMRLAPYKPFKIRVFDAAFDKCVDKGR